VDALYHPSRLQDLSSSFSHSSTRPPKGEFLMETDKLGGGDFMQPENQFNSSSKTDLQELEKLC
jgi:hypothetical protein